MVSQCFASLRRLSQFMVSQAFARIRKLSQMDFRRDSPRIRKCENHGFSQGFAMGTLLMIARAENLIQFQPDQGAGADTEARMKLEKLCK